MEAITKKKDPILLVREHQYQENPKVSVIVPVYKVDKYLTQCLNSIVNQTMEELEIIIVDEGDQDRCREIIDFFEKNDPRIVAPHKKNGGYAASCNLGLDIARGEYIAIVESDDFIEPEMYEEMYEYAKALDADVVKTPYYEVFCDGRKYDCNYRKFMSENAPRNMCFSVKDFGEILQVHPSVWSGLYKTEYMNKAHIRFVDKKGSYVDCGFRISFMNTDKVAWLDKPYYNWRVDSEGSSTNTYKISQMIDRWNEFLLTFTDRKDEFEEYYASHLIGEVYRNLIDSVRFHRIQPTDQDYARIGDIIHHFPETAIVNSNEINDEIKKELILFRNDPALIKRTVEKQNRKVEVKHKTKIFIEKMSNPILLFFSFVGFETFGGIAYFLNNSFANHTATTIFDVTALLFAATVFASFAAKISKKLYYFIKRHRKEDY